MDQKAHKITLTIPKGRVVKIEGLAMQLNTELTIPNLDEGAIDYEALDAEA